MHDIIRIDHLSKRFGEVQAVQDLSFRVKEGELFAFLGVNGAWANPPPSTFCAASWPRMAAAWKLTARIRTATRTGSGASLAWCFRIPYWTGR